MTCDSFHMFHQLNEYNYALCIAGRQLIGRGRDVLWFGGFGLRVTLPSILSVSVSSLFALSLYIMNTINLCGAVRAGSRLGESAGGSLCRTEID